MSDKGIFVSYSHKDRNIVGEIVNYIKDANEVNVWWDKELVGGEHYFSKIAEEILRNDIFVFCASEHSVISPFCIKELEYAMSEDRNIVAINIDNVVLPPRIKLIVQGTHYIFFDKTSDKFKVDLINAIYSKAIVKRNNLRSNTEGDFIDDNICFLTNIGWGCYLFPAVL